MATANQDGDEGQDSSKTKTITTSHQDDPIPNQDSPSTRTLTSKMKAYGEILKKVPVKSFFRFRLIFNSDSVDEIKTCRLSNVLNNNVNSVDAIEHVCPLDKPVCIVGSCDGLVCLSAEDDDYNDILFIWNPATRRSTRLPKHGLTEAGSSFGFGFDESSNDYKVAVIFTGTENGARRATNLMIYSLKTGDWKEIGGSMPHHRPCGDYIKFVGRALCWAGKGSESKSWKIISLDLATESYGEVLEPIYDEGDFKKGLGVLDNQLCVLCNYKGLHADVWVMKEFTTRGLWTEFITLPYLSEPSWGRHLQLWNAKEGKILFQLSSQLVVYHEKDESFQDINNLHIDFVAFTYVESLVSPDAYNKPGNGKQGTSSIRKRGMLTCFPDFGLFTNFSHILEHRQKTASFLSPLFSFRVTCVIRAGRMIHLVLTFVIGVSKTGLASFFPSLLLSFSLSIVTGNLLQACNLC